MPTSGTTSSMPFSCCVAWSAFSAEKQMPRSLCPSNRRSLSFAVTTATDCPVSATAARIVGARSHLGSFIMTSALASTSNNVLPQMPCTEGGAPVTIDRLLGLVKLGTTQSASSAVPSDNTRFRCGMRPPATACAM